LKNLAEHEDLPNIDEIFYSKDVAYGKPKIPKCIAISTTMPPIDYCY
jgi:hypothetical protein